LSAEEEQVYQRLIREVYPEVNEMITNPLIERGRQEGIQLGVQQGKQSMLLHQLSAKFGVLSEPVVQEIRTITSEQELDRLSLRILTANSINEMGLDGQAKL
jgi:predicted transposase YdaD